MERGCSYAVRSQPRETNLYWSNYPRKFSREQTPLKQVKRKKLINLWSLTTVLRMQTNWSSVCQGSPLYIAVRVPSMMLKHPWKKLCWRRFFLYGLFCWRIWNSWTLKTSPTKTYKGQKEKESYEMEIRDNSRFMEHLARVRTKFFVVQEIRDKLPNNFL